MVAVLLFFEDSTPPDWTNRDLPIAKNLAPGFWVRFCKSPGRIHPAKLYTMHCTHKALRSRGIPSSYVLNTSYPAFKAGSPALSFLLRTFGHQNWLSDTWVMSNKTGFKHRDSAGDKPCMPWRRHTCAISLPFKPRYICRQRLGPSKCGVSLGIPICTLRIPSSSACKIESLAVLKRERAIRMRSMVRRQP